MKVGDITVGGRIIGTVTLNEQPILASLGEIGGDADSSPAGYGARRAEGRGSAPGAMHGPGRSGPDKGEAKSAYPDVNMREPTATGGEKVYGRLAEARDKAREDLKNNPALNDKAMHIFAGENPDPQAATALWENAINRSAVRGTSLEKELRHTSEGGYYAGWRDHVSPSTRKVLEEARDRALAHSNVSNYATDNASGGLAARDAATGRFQERTKPMNGERFFGPDTRIPSHMRAWRSLVNESEAGRAADPAEGASGSPGAAASPSAAGATGTNTASTPGLVRGVDPRVQEIVNAAATHLPEGHSIRMTSGYRDGTPNHSGNAADYQIVGPNGPISNRGEDPTGLYTTLARHAYGEMLARHPELNGRFAWGGAFGTQLGGGGQRDLMHFDIKGERGRYAEHQLHNMGPVPGVKYGPQEAAATPPEKTASATGDNPFDLQTMVP